MRTTSRGRALGLLAAAGLLLSLTSRSGADDADPPERVAVADLIEGSAAAQFAGAGDWTADLANRPLTSGDKVWVDANSRAELHLGSMAIRLGANTGLQFLNVADSVAQLRLSAGSMNVRLRYCRRMKPLRWIPRIARSPCCRPESIASMSVIPVMR